ncbi:oxygenase MpaB family protein [Phenylobacterium sp.]|uniref:oxygenase MpaB family protein n=1 Tax=Phenylobacterium sp. TaxID=1871053 RepID=UPI0035B22CDD
MSAADAAFDHPPAAPEGAAFRPARIDYLSPAGDRGLYGPDSVAWRVHANPIALGVGGICAVILELAEPRVRTGVWEHSIFARQPLLRMQRTGEATMITTYGSTADALKRIAMVTRMHEKVAGTTPEGQAFHALDGDLMTWVHATAGFGFLNAYLSYVAPLSAADQDRYYAEGAAVGLAFGAPGPPGSVAGVEALFRAMTPNLAPHRIIDEFLGIVRRTGPFGLAGRALQPLVVEAAIDLVPADIRARLGLSVSPARLALARPMLRAMAAAARKAPGPVVRDAYARMGRKAFG